MNRHNTLTTGAEEGNQTATINKHHRQASKHRLQTNGEMGYMSREKNREFQSGLVCGQRISKGSYFFSLI